MSVIGIYCDECNKLIGAEDTETLEREYHDRWCGEEGVNRCYGCFNPFDIPILEDDEGD